MSANIGVTAAMTLEMALEYILDLLASGEAETLALLWSAKEPVARAARMHREEAKGSISTSLRLRR